VAIPLATAWVKIKPDLKTFPKETEEGIGRARLDRVGDKEGRKFGSRFTSGFKSLMKGALVGTGAILAAGLAGAVVALKNVFDAARDAGKVLRLTEAVIKSTGGVAHVTAKQVFELSQRLSEQSGIEDDVVQAGANMLLTFKNIRNVQGKNNDVFNQATTVLVDMTAAMRGGDVNAENLRKQAIQLGKALNDPVKGMSALKRVGVTFSDAQVKTIKRLVDTGNVLAAQKIILRELTSEFGGAAKATADPLKRFSAAFHNIEEDVGLRLMPILSGLANWILTTGIPRFDDFWKHVGAPAAKKAIGVVSQAWNLLSKGAPGPVAPAGHAPAKPPEVTGWQKTVLTVRNVILTDIVPAVKVFFGWVSRIWGQLVVVGAQMWPIWRDVWKFVTQLWAAVVLLWKAWAPIVGPVLKLALAALVIVLRLVGWVLSHVIGPAIVLLAKFSLALSLSMRKDFSLVGKAWSAVWSSARAFFATFVDIVLGYFGNLLHAAATAFGWIPGIGGKLKTAASHFDTFRKNVNNSLTGINGRQVTVGVSFSGKELSGAYFSGQASRRFKAKGGPITGPGGPTADRAGLFALSNDEYVVRASSHRKYGSSAMDAVNRGTADIQYRAEGGPAGLRVHADTPPQSVVNRIVNQAVLAMAAKLRPAGSASIVADAMRWIGKIPYVWGGTRVPGGADCSGFVQTIYGRHGIRAPRTSEAQGAWVRQSPPIPGGLAFYNSPAGGPPPGHVAIVGRNGMVISQGGGLGPQYVPLRSMALMFTGIPPGGFRGFAGGGRITEPILGIGRSGRRYSFGESGEETVVPGRFSTRRLEERLDRLIAAVERNAAQTGAAVGDALNGASRSAAYAARYSVG